MVLFVSLAALSILVPLPHRAASTRDRQDGPVCQAIPGLDSLLATTPVLWLGEMHGTVESPAFVSNAACLALRGERPVTVALEIPAEERARVDAFLASRGCSTVHSGARSTRMAAAARPCSHS